MCITNFLYKFQKNFMYILYKKNEQRNWDVRCLTSLLLYFSLILRIIWLGLPLFGALSSGRLAIHGA